ncbi:UNVERIFIED_CONTAM: hypothetical protein Sradi_5815000 [Sesamum radiatum]|uniref:Retrotransposon Copia-like N-terminal domain-containing protein n=1 Tax=Sesamum radiatum TaxID=300843 RepID=A0AAW2KQC3_SESRA
MESTSATTENSKASEHRQNIPEQLQLHGSDHPGMVLVSAPLSGSNYLNWSCGIKRALRSKLKLCFIDGTSMKPRVDDPLFEQWIRVDDMVTTWILNSISKEIVEAFMYTESARSLWLDLEGQCNVLLLYQLQHAISSLSQGNMSLAAYFTKLKKLWDEVSELMPTPQCTYNGYTCGASKAVAELAVFRQLMQFLMGLCGEFDGVRHQWLVIDPVPYINKAYSMVQSMEKQKEVHMERSDVVEIAMHVKAGFKNDLRKRNMIDKIAQ